MAGNTANAAVWGEADVYIGSLTATIPTTNAAFTLNETSGGGVGVTDEWDFVGLLDGGQGFEEGIEVSETQHSAWGYGTIFTTYKDQILTKTFTTLEENSTVLNLVYDTDGMTFDNDAGTYSGDLGVRDHTTQVLIAFELRSGSKIKRYISKGYATVAPTSAGTDSEESLGSKGFTATIYPDSNQKLWSTYKGAAA